MTAILDVNILQSAGSTGIACGAVDGLGRRAAAGGHPHHESAGEEQGNQLFITLSLLLIGMTAHPVYAVGYAPMRRADSPV